jgi:drug/metabolite transporter (DMT)-like permease
VTALTAHIPLAFAAASLLGLAIVAGQLGVRSAATLPGAVVANASAAALFWAAAPWYLDGEGFDLPALAIFALVGLFFPAAVTMLMLEGNRRLGPARTASISGTTPLFAYAAAIAFLGEELRPAGLLGTLVIVAGIVVLTGRAARAQTVFSTAWVLLPLAAAVIRGIAQIPVKYGLLWWPSPYAATLVAYSTSAALLGLLCGLRGQAIPLQPAMGWFAAAGLLNGIGLLAMYGAILHGPVSVVAPIVATAPLVTLAVYVFFLRAERLTLRLLLGVGLTLAGVWLILLR